MSGTLRSRFGLILTVAIIAGLASACAPIPVAPPAPPAEEPVETQTTERSPAAVSAAPLDGTSWVLATTRAAEEAAVPAGAPVTLSFLDGAVSGYAGCNSYTGTYKATESSLEIVLGATTTMACESPEGVMEQEKAFLDALGMVASYRVEERQLALLDAQGATLVLMELAEGEPAAAAGRGAAEGDTVVIGADLTGLVWQWVETTAGDQIVQAIAEPERYTVSFLPDGSLAIKADCNSVSGTYSLADSSLTIFLGATTLVACPPDSQADVFLQQLSEVESHLLSEGSLVLNLGGNGGAMKFMPASSAQTVTAVPAAPEAAGASGAAAALPLPQVTGNTQGLTQDVAVKEVAETAYSETSGAAPAGAPAHIAVAFGGQDIIRVYPAQAYADLWQAAGDDTVSRTIEELRLLLSERPAGVEPPVPMLPPAYALNDLVAKYHYLEFTQGSGIAFVGRISAERTPVLNSELRYYFQGLTSDGAYYVSIEVPITTPALPDSAEAMAAEERQLMEADFDGYLLQVAANLDGLSSTSFTPDLAKLDAMVESINVTVPESAVSGTAPEEAASGSEPPAPEIAASAPKPAPVAPEVSPQAPELSLTSVTWSWVEATGPDGAVTSVAEPARYTLAFLPDGIVSIGADCNRGAGAYQEKGDRLAIKIGALTRAACPAGSLEKDFLHHVAAATGYTIQQGVLTLTLKPGGTLKFLPLETQ